MNASSSVRARRLLVLGAVSGFLAVAAGAFGAHALKESLPAENLAWFETGVRYHLVHAVALFLAGMLAERRRGPGAAVAGEFFLWGSVLFSGSLYVLALTGMSWLGAVTPFGGVAWLVAWAMLAVAAARPDPS